MRKYQLASGKVLEFNLAGVEQALSVYRAVLHECKGAGLDITVLPEETIADVIIKNKEAVLNIMSSEAVMDAVVECCGKVLYDKQHFSIGLFNDEKAREDLLPVIAIVGMETIRPFFPALRSFLDAIQSLFLKQ